MALTFRQVHHFVATAETERVSAAAAGLSVALGRHRVNQGA